ncbi:MAG: PEP-CTERM sorting domain-containing protein [Verrucomicrobiaceae bacterium]
MDHDFANGTAGELGSGGAIGTPAAGTVDATGGFISDGGNRGYTTGSNGSNNAITTVADGTFNSVGSPAGNYLTATLSSPAAITGELGIGQTTTVSFNVASFGTSNSTAFKYAHIVGLSSSGAEVFHIVWHSGSGSGTRRVFANEFGEDSTTFAAGAYAGQSGTKILDNVAFGISSTNTSTQPASIGVSITIDNAGWGASAAPTGGSSTQTPASGLGIASGADNLASLVFFSSHNTSVNAQNKGLWVDNLLVDTDLVSVPEPSSALLSLIALMGFMRRKRS